MVKLSKKELLIFTALFLIMGTLGVAYSCVPFIFYRPTVTYLETSEVDVNLINKYNQNLDFDSYQKKPYSELHVCDILAQYPQETKIIKQTDYETIYSILTPNEVTTNKVIKFTYNEKLESITKKFNLTCENKIQQTYMQGAGFSGQIIGAIISLFLRFSHQQLKYIYTILSLVLGLDLIAFQFAESVYSITILLTIWNCIIVYFMSNVNYFCNNMFPDQFAKYAAALLNSSWGVCFVLFIFISLYLPNYQDNLTIVGIQCIISFVILLTQLDFKNESKFGEQNIDSKPQNSSLVSQLSQITNPLIQRNSVLSQVNPIEVPEPVYENFIQNDQQQNQKEQTNTSIQQNDCQKQGEDYEQQQQQQDGNDDNNKNQQKNFSQQQNNQQQKIGIMEQIRLVYIEFYDSLIEMKCNPDLIQTTIVWVLSYSTAMVAYAMCNLILDQLEGNLYMNSIVFSSLELVGGLLSGFIVYLGWNLKTTLQINFLLQGVIYALTVFFFGTQVSSDNFAEILKSIAPILIAKLSFELVWTLLMTYLRDLMRSNHQLFVVAISQLFSKISITIVPFYIFFAEYIGINKFSLLIVLCLCCGYMTKNYKITKNNFDFNKNVKNQKQVNKNPNNKTESFIEMCNL
ncbi:Major facilitator superfamily domain, general substrate transporter [Pseudocohnilembus persalinus]|uniref:Major facilitator superfamily domain, general substrate transporter n=1 Tax=Pseudocohnilembus persalinus TaxID=266149 RepID=A0A0V0QLX2_PSEPJ|nr:Major facilitator superfamily domain, general substrate transporter [Pseudocohnilembus persalinus]|eukprot:KRX03250.1 Major facilitator superfamily domain, general substrate transporter [Pseudocohnilembus persalinus]